VTRPDQLTLPLVRPRTDQDVEVLTLGSRNVPVQFVRNPRARHYVLRVAPDGGVRLTVPRGGNRAEARAFVRKQLRWIDSERYAAARAGAAIRVHGELLPLKVERGPETDLVSFGDRRVTMRRGETARVAVCRCLREAARRELPPRLLTLARQFGLCVRRITIRSQQTRWGSCSDGGAISLNWRLVQMPDSVRDYILIHELMHLRERAHGRRFWRTVEEVCPLHREARRWLKQHEKELL
jgi:predicted metal-dependent hydrolase